jgi:hypothetical protein
MVIERPEPYTLEPGIVRIFFLEEGEGGRVMKTVTK